MTDLLDTLPPPSVRLPLREALAWVFAGAPCARVIVAPSGRRYRVGFGGDHLEVRADTYWTPAGPNLRRDLLGSWRCEVVG